MGENSRPLSAQRWRERNHKANLAETGTYLQLDSLYICISTICCPWKLNVLFLCLFKSLKIFFLLFRCYINPDSNQTFELPLVIPVYVSLCVVFVYACVCVCVYSTHVAKILFVFLLLISF